MRVILISFLFLVVFSISVNAQDNLAGYWHFNEGSGTKSMDASGNGNIGTLYNYGTECSNGNCPTWVNGKYGKAIKFDGVEWEDDYVEISDSQGMRYDRQTVCLWVNPDYQGMATYTNHNDIIRKWNNWAISTTEFFDTTQQLSILDNYASDCSGWVWNGTGLSLNINSWNFLCTVWDSVNGKVKVYINGNSEEFDVPTGKCADTSNVKIATGYAGPFKGLIDEVMIFDSALTSEEIDTLYQATCKGSIRLSITPVFASPSSHVEPSAYGLSDCYGRIVYFKQDSCSGSQVSSCTASGTGCVGNGFAVPSVSGTVEYYACVDENGNGAYDTGEKYASLIYTIGYNSLPEFNWMGIIQIMVLSIIVLLTRKK